MYGAPMIGVVIWWFVDAHNWFKGPKVNIEHQMGRDEAIIEGISIGEGDAGAGSLLVTDVNKKLTAEDFT